VNVSFVLGFGFSLSLTTRLRLARVATVVLTIAAQGQGNPEGGRAAHPFVSEKYGFSIAVPPGWSARLSHNDTPAYVNYPASRALPQLRLPEGGALISVVVNETLYGRHSGNSLREWAVNDMRIETDGTPASPKPFEMPLVSDVKDAIILSYDSAIFGAGEQGQHCVAIYWEFRGKPFAAYLHYVANDPKGVALERIFLTTVRSFRPLRSSDKR
jgi:hypothetical protein